MSGRIGKFAGGSRGAYASGGQGCATPHRSGPELIRVAVSPIGLITYRATWATIGHNRGGEKRQNETWVIGIGQGPVEGDIHRILIIDDDEALRKMLRFRLQENYEVIDTSSPEQGLILALQNKPDAILVDLMMPSHTGFEVCQTLHSLTFTEVIPIFVISGAPKALYKDFCHTLGASGYIEKPIDFDALQTKLSVVLGAGRRDRRAEARVNLRLGVKLRGVDHKGEPFEMLTSTENVSRHGFTCGVNVRLNENAVVDLFVWTRTSRRFTGQAKLVWLDWPDMALMPLAGFRFVQEPVEWIF